MKLLLERVYRGFILFFAGLILLGCWASAQQPAATNAPGTATQNEPGLQPSGRTVVRRDVFLNFGLDRVPILDETIIAGLPLWQYLASLIYIFLAFYVSKFFDYLTRAYLKRWAERTETKFDDLLV